MCIHSDVWVPKTEEKQAEIAQHHRDKRERLKQEQEEFDAMTPEEQLAHTRRGYEEVAEQIPTQYGGGRGGRFMQERQADLYEAGIINAQGNPRPGISNPRQMLAMNYQNRLGNNPRGNVSGAPLRMTPFGPTANRGS